MPLFCHLESFKVKSIAKLKKKKQINIQYLCSSKIEEEIFARLFKKSFLKTFFYLRFRIRIFSINIGSKIIYVILQNFSRNF